MTDLVKSKSSEIWGAIQSSQKILMCCHPSPDPDSICSNLALYHALTALGKQVSVIAGDTEIPKTISHLPGVAKIIPKNWTQINPSDFDLFLSLDASSLEQITKLAKIIFPPTLKTIVIDHHASNQNFGYINLLDTTYISTGEIVFDLFSEWQLPLTKDIAANLYLAIYTDSGGFKYPKTSIQTYQTAIKLIEIFPDFSNLVFLYENQNDPETITSKVWLSVPSNCFLIIRSPSQ